MHTEGKCAAADFPSLLFNYLSIPQNICKFAKKNLQNNG